MDPEQIKLLTEELQRLNRVMEMGFRGMADAAKKMETSGRTTIQRLGQAWTKELEDGGDALIDTSESLGRRMGRALTAPLRTSLSDTIRHYKDEIRTLGRQFDERVLRGADKAGGMFEGLQNLNRTLFAGLPFGGILGVMLFGRMQEAEYFSKAQQAGQVLQRSGQLGGRIIGQLTADIRTLEQTIPGIAQNFMAANSAIAEMGFTGHDAATSIDQGLDGARDTVLNLTVAMDRFFEVGAGESAKFAAQIAQNTNGSLKESVELVRDIGLAVQDTGISFNVMLGSIMQVTSALRLQTNELEEAKDIATAIQQAQAGFRAEGIADQRAGALAAAGLQGIAGALNNMRIGLKAVIGERMTQGRVTGLGAVRQFETGMRSMEENPQFFRRAISEIIRMSHQEARGDVNIQYEVLKQLFNLTAEQAQTLLAIQTATKEGLPLEKATEQNMDALTKAFRDEGLKQSVFKQMINRLIQVVAKVGASLLDVIVSGLEMLVASVTYLAKFLTMGTTTTEAAAFDRLVLQGGNRVGRAAQTAYDQFAKEGPDIASLFAGTVLGRSDRDRQRSSDYWREIGRPERPEHRRSLDDAIREMLPKMLGGRASQQVPQPAAVGVSGAWQYGASRSFDVDLDIEVPPRGTRARGRGKIDLVAPPTPE